VETLKGEKYLRARCSCEDNIKMDIKELAFEYVDRIRPVPNWILKDALLNISASLKCTEFLDYMRDC
jgi:hypothetical protein